MKKRGIGIIIATMAAGLIVFIICTVNRDTKDRVNLLDQNTHTASQTARHDKPDKTASISPAQTVSGESVPLDPEEVFDASLAYVREMEARGLQVGGVPKRGMITHDVLIKKAFLKALSSSTTNQKPHIVLLNDIYIVSLPRHTNPFRVGEPGYDLRMGFDAWTGEYITGLRGGGGITVLNVSKETGAGKVGEVPEAAEYKQRVFDSLEKLELNIIYGRPWGLEPLPDMIDPAEAVGIAQQQVVNRDYDREKEPLTLLVDDLYIVTFWDIDTDKLPEGRAAYDSRVGIDAYTGEYIAMEITRENRTP